MKKPDSSQKTGTADRKIKNVDLAKQNSDSRKMAQSNLEFDARNNRSTISSDSDFGKNMDELENDQ